MQQIETAFVLGGALPRQQVVERRQDQEAYRSPQVADLFTERWDTDRPESEADREWASEPPRFPEAPEIDAQDPFRESAATPDRETEAGPVVEVTALPDEEGRPGATGFAEGHRLSGIDAPDPFRAPELGQPRMISGADELAGGADVERAVLVEQQLWPRLADSEGAEPIVTAEPATERRATRRGFLAALLLVGALGLGLLASRYGHQQLTELGPVGQSPVGQLSGWLHQTGALELDYGAWVAVLLLAVVLGASLSVWRSDRRPVSAEPDLAEQLLARISGNRPRPQVEMLLVVLLALLAVWQLGYGQRDKLLQNPGMRRAITQACQVLGCRLEPLTDIAKIRLLDARIISPAGRAGVLEVDAALVNDAAFSQPYPRIRLSFQSIDGAFVASRTFPPRQYLRGALVDPTRMVAGVPVSLHLELVDPGPAATNYHFDLLPGAGDSGDRPTLAGR